MIYINQLYMKIRGHLQVSCGRHKTDHFSRNIRRNKGRNWVTDENIRHLDTLPDPCPSLLLRCTRRVDKVTPDLDMAAKNDGTIGCYLFRHLHYRGHLRVIQDHNISSSISRCTQGTACRCPVSVGIVAYPIAHGLLVVSRKALVRRRDSLEDIMVCFGDTEHPWTWFGDIPIKLSA